MPPVFNRALPDPHPYDAALAACLSSDDPGYRAVARNIMHDHRVSEEREKKLLKHYGSPGDAKTLNRTLVDYKMECVQKRKLPDYVLRALNHTNIISLAPPGQCPHPDTWLVRIINLNGLHIVYAWAKHLSRAFDDYPGKADVGRWLNRWLERRSAKDVCEF
ncbi:MAG TPA: hypothetical protein VLS89_14630, partial [Candidatus Nanopelagicales bacterium]|nr:hypothetical protein [Candidatus Nanopelagicales bacterium]